MPNERETPSAFPYGPCPRTHAADSMPGKEHCWVASTVWEERGFSWPCLWCGCVIRYTGPGMPVKPEVKKVSRGKGNGGGGKKMKKKIEKDGDGDVKMGDVGEEEKEKKEDSVTAVSSSSKETAAMEETAETEPVSASSVLDGRVEVEEDGIIVGEVVSPAEHRWERFQHELQKRSRVRERFLSIVTVRVGGNHRNGKPAEAVRDLSQEQKMECVCQRFNFICLEDARSLLVHFGWRVPAVFEMLRLVQHDKRMVLDLIRDARQTELEKVMRSNQRSGANS
jgi:hypothetical protein